MGGKWSKRSVPGWNTIRERMRRTHPAAPGPGTRFPLTFGWCFKLVPVEPEKIEEATVGENNCLLHPMNLHGMDDPEGEVLVWKFDSRLAFHHMAREKHPEFYKDC
uniref:Protein Nef n=1 Tax=Human immunodeficiency virus type 1 TaxID=11676 RepID=B6E3M4_HV1|nr:nef protein [Human immunodeficiency virus 1]